MSRRPRSTLAAAPALVALALAAGCGSTSQGSPASASATTGSAPSGSAHSGSDSSRSASPSAHPSAHPSVDPASVHADELGVVPVLMYHQLKANPGTDRYNQTPEQFRAELERLAKDGFVPVTAAAFETGAMDLPAGKHPVVLTFDDSTVSQVALTPAGEPKPGTALAIIQDVAAAHPGFTATATFFVNGDPFVDPAGSTLLPWLVKHGYEVGGHTTSHANLRKLDGAGIQTEIGSNVAMIQTAVPQYTVTSFALPYGVSPVDKTLSVSGGSGADAYSFHGVYLVGSNPAPSPFDSRFTASAIPRIRSQSLPGTDAPYESSHYLDTFEADPTEFYTSDGDPDHVSFPAAKASRLASAESAKARPY